MMLIFGLMLLLQTAASPIGSVEVSIICSSNQRSVFCSSDGDQIIYSWTLNGEILEQGPMNGNTTIQLKEETDGDIICSVKNHVSHAETSIRLKPCPGLDLFCSFGQSGPCYAALGDKLNLLMVDARKYDLHLIKRINDNTADDPVCRVKNDNKKECDLYKNRPEVTVINGTVIIKRVNRSDSGNYRLTLTESDGTETSRDLQVIVEAPIGSVNVSIICSSNQRSVFCSSDGDHIISSWTLNGEILEQGPVDGNTTIQLKEGNDGDIICSVKNHVSHAQTSIRLKPCPGPTTAAVTPTPESGLDRFCSFDQSDSCNAALGDKLNLLMVDAREYDLQLKKRINNNTADDQVCRVKNDNKKECDLYKNRPEVTVINGTVIIKRVNRADSGNYTLTLYNSVGTETSRDLQVIVEAPIGSVNVSIICSSNQRSVFCSSDGDHIIYNWTLNGEILEQGPMNGNTSIQLKEETDGDISCSVKNNVSHAQKTIRLKPCPGPTTAAVTSSLTSTKNGTSLSSDQTHTEEFRRMLLQFSLIALGCVALILILLFITVCYIYKKKQVKSTQAAAGDMELIYADISHEKKSEKKNTESFSASDVEYAAVQPQTKRKKKKNKEEVEEVQYGEVTFTPKQATAPQQKLQEECVYSQVQRD
ncbi:uncharacterized protein LOC113058057 [Carassius auratus]|uniref:Uncharacterized protein LOC113058057 n=1 Tax=Carassius auratus TaxID=7957 RepID=A0A6P6LAE2_CARAU|nr:uncharacterized protein LOC113058057 [Carassius auratus]